MNVLYDSNNSGGYWWLSEDDWKHLEEAGWKLLYWNDSGFAHQAVKQFNSVEEAIQEWEQIVQQDPNAEGCECCGPPHNFMEISDEYLKEVQGVQI